MQAFDRDSLPFLDTSFFDWKALNVSTLCHKVISISPPLVPICSPLSQEETLSK